MRKWFVHFLISFMLISLFCFKGTNIGVLLFSALVFMPNDTIQISDC